MNRTNNSANTHPGLVERVKSTHARGSQGAGIRLSRIWNILRYYRTSQIALRAIKAVRNRVGLVSRTLPDAAAGAPYAVRAQSEFDTIRRIRTSNCFREPAEIRNGLIKNEVTVLNLTGPLSWKNDGSERQSLLWKFQLHYHEYLLPLAGESSTDLDLELIEQTIESWIEANPISHRDRHRDAWHPYCISRRLPVWFCLMTIANLDDSVRDRMRQSAHLQAEFLSHNLEWVLRGNHLLENLRALALAGCFFDTDQSNRWLALVRQILPRQIKEQVLSHGEHFERCPMYHGQILGNFLETLIACENVDPILRGMVLPTAEKMYEFLIRIVHPDGEIPLLGDSCFGESPSVLCLEQLAGAAGIAIAMDEKPADDPHVTSIGDYWIYRDQNDALIFDRGPAGAETLPAHAHCDLLTLESSIGGVRWLVDSGLYNYENDPMRWYCRSSLAHNVVCVDDQNQSDVWSKFRMGYRGTTSDLRNGRDGEFVWAVGSHNGYRRFGVRKISRLIGIEKGKFWYCADRAEPSTQRNLSGFLHLAPIIEATLVDDQVFRLKFGENEFELSFFGASGVKIDESWYCPEFGRRETNSAIEYTFDPVSPVSGWLLTPEQPLSVNATPERPKLDVKRKKRSDQISISTVASGAIHTFNWNTTQ